MAFKLGEAYMAQDLTALLQYKKKILGARAFEGREKLEEARKRYEDQVQMTLEDLFKLLVDGSRKPEERRINPTQHAFATWNRPHEPPSNNASATQRAAERGVDLQTAIETGRPSRMIVSYAEENDIDHIVIGSHGRTGASRILLGSVAESVTRRSSVPVTIVR